MDDRFDLQPSTPIVEQPPSGSLLVATAAGLAAAIVGGVVWGLIVKWSEYEIGIVAWGIGFLVGAAVLAVTRGRKGTALQVVAVAAALVGILLGKYLGFAFTVQEQLESLPSELGLEIGLFSSEMRSGFREELGSVFGLFDVLWVGLALYTAWRALQPEQPEPLPGPVE